MTLIKDLMSTKLITVSIEDTMLNVAEIFEKENIHHLPVVDESESLCGIISSTDFERIKHGTTLFRNPKIESYNKALYQTTLVKTVMTKDVISLRPADNIKKAYDLFSKNKYHALPVTDKGSVIGIITPLDLLHHFMK